MPDLRPFTALLSLLLLGFGCSRGPESSADGAANAQAAGAPAKTYGLGKVESRPLERYVDATGSLFAIDQTPVSVKVPGRLVGIHVDLGSRVKAGELLASVESADYDLRLRQSEAALGEARARVGLPLEGGDDRFEVERSSKVVEARAVMEEATANRDRIRVLSEQGILSASELETASSAHKVAVSRYQEALEEVRTRLAQLQQRRAEYEIARKQ
ncbi:MAG: biotin/lipoyl-binding protein, partial [Verrucomicrobiales bacterium]|nr:biotin/lipoyl-binding protein [Verrucomicrobiales bacterium]